MNLLQDGIKNGIVIPTEITTKQTVGGHTEIYPVYKVRLDALFYNDQNDRIATWMSRYKSENKVDEINKDDLEEYNNIIQQFITESNPDKLKATQNNIRECGQDEPGIVLNDGRIIDGNRRFTCLRNLAKTNLKYNFFETIILDKDLEANAKQIKMLELKVQMGKDEKVDYDPIDRLVGVYNAIIDEKLLTIEEYAMSIGKSKKEVEELIELAKLLDEFLETMNASKCFYLARDLNLNGPLHELNAILKKIKDDEKREQVKLAVFTNFFIQPEGDMTRFVRQLKKVAKSNKHLEEFVEKENPIVENVLDRLPEGRTLTKEDIKEIRKDERTKEDLKDIMEVVTNKVKVTETRNKPLQNLNKAFDSIDSIDTNIFLKLNENQLSDIIGKLDEIEKRVAEIKEELDV